MDRFVATDPTAGFLDRDKLGKFVRHALLSRRSRWIALAQEAMFKRSIRKSLGSYQNEIAQLFRIRNVAMLMFVLPDFLYRFLIHYLPTSTLERLLHG
jgi:hypothetical protein